MSAGGGGRALSGRPRGPPAVGSSLTRTGAGSKSVNGAVLVFRRENRKERRVRSGSVPDCFPSRGSSPPVSPRLASAPRLSGWKLLAASAGAVVTSVLSPKGLTREFAQSPQPWAWGA